MFLIELLESFQEWVENNKKSLEYTKKRVMYDSNFNFETLLNREF